MAATLQNPLVQQRLVELGSDLVSPDRMTPDYLRKFVAAEVEKWRRAIAASGVQLE
jgi:hypothetical protein